MGKKVRPRSQSEKMTSKMTANFFKKYLCALLSLCWETKGVRVVALTGVMLGGPGLSPGVESVIQRRQILLSSPGTGLGI
jgi:hypothetical protein